MIHRIITYLGENNNISDVYVIFILFEQDSDYCVTLFLQRTWQRLRATEIFHDAIPHPYDRVGHPLHVKVRI